MEMKEKLKVGVLGATGMVGETDMYQFKDWFHWIPPETAMLYYMNRGENG